MSKYLQKYRIKFKGLSAGIYHYELDVDAHFFSFFPESEINEGEIKINVDLTVEASNLQFDFLVSGKVKVICDICAEEFLLPINHKAKLHVNFGDENSDITDVDEVLTLSHNESEIDLSQHIFEYIHLSLPYKRIHPKDEYGNSTCDQQMVEKINSYYIKDEKEESIDPRWEQLKNLYN